MLTVILEKAKIGKELKKDGMTLIKHVEALGDEEKAELMEFYKTNEEKEFIIEGKSLKLNRNLIKFDLKSVNVMEEKFIPHVIEPAFGIGRII